MRAIEGAIEKVPVAMRGRASCPKNLMMRQLFSESAWKRESSIARHSGEIRIFSKPHSSNGISHEETKSIMISRETRASCDVRAGYS